MPITIVGNSSAWADVDTTWKAIRLSLRPLDIGLFGQYKVAVQSGLISGASVVAGAPWFSARWAAPNAFAVITYFRAKLTPITTFTALQEVGMNLNIARGWTVSDSAGTAISLANNAQKCRTKMQASLFSMGDMRICVSNLLTAGTRTLDSNPIANSSGNSHYANPASATAALMINQPSIEWQADMLKGEEPIVLSYNEGIVLTNTIVFSGSGTARLCVEMAWAEIGAF